LTRHGFLGSIASGYRWKKPYQPLIIGIACQVGRYRRLRPLNSVKLPIAVPLIAQYVHCSGQSIMKLLKCWQGAPTTSIFAFKSLWVFPATFLVQSRSDHYALQKPRLTSFPKEFHPKFTCFSFDLHPVLPESLAGIAERSWEGSDDFRQ
jgi:hypothetical protein